MYMCVQLLIMLGVYFSHTLCFARLVTTIISVNNPRMPQATILITKQKSRAHLNTYKLISSHRQRTESVTAVYHTALPTFHVVATNVF